MNTRTEQDNNIKNYSYHELVNMAQSYKSNSSTWKPFTYEEVRSEINRRDKETFELAKSLNMLNK
jgi:hypothetical protein